MAQAPHCRVADSAAGERQRRSPGSGGRAAVSSRALTRAPPFLRRSPPSTATTCPAPWWCWALMARRWSTAWTLRSSTTPCFAGRRGCAQGTIGLPALQCPKMCHSPPLLCSPPALFKTHLPAAHHHHHPRPSPQVPVKLGGSLVKPVWSGPEPAGLKEAHTDFQIFFQEARRKGGGGECRGRPKEPSANKTRR